MNRSALVVVAGVAGAAVGLGAGAIAFRMERAPTVPQAAERKVLYYRDPMNPARTSPVPRKDEMGMDYVPVYEGSEGAEETQRKGGVYVDPRMAQRSGVRVEEVRVRPMKRVIRTVGRVTYDERRLHDVNAKVMGWIEKLYVDYTGKRVRRGDPVMAIYSPDLFSTQLEYLLALRHRNAVAADGELRASAEDLLEGARQRLLYFDIPPSRIRDLERRGIPTKTLTLYSPADGYVVEKSVVQGTQVTPGTPLFKVADLSNVWVLADVYEYELPWVATGQPATVELPYAPGTALKGRITYIYPSVAGDTRTVKVRVEVHNPGGRIELKPDMYATVTIRSPVVREAVAVPEQAVIRTGPRSVGIVALGEGWFEPRDLTLGVTADGYVEVLAGVRAGEQLVTSSQFLIDSESNLRSAAAAMGSHGGMQGSGTPASPGKAAAPAHPGDHGPQGGEARRPPPGRRPARDVRDDR